MHSRFFAQGFSKGTQMKIYSSPYRLHADGTQPPTPLEAGHGAPTADLFEAQGRSDGIPGGMLDENLDGSLDLDLSDPLLMFDGRSSREDRNLRLLRCSKERIHTARAATSELREYVRNTRLLILQSQETLRQNDESIRRLLRLSSNGSAAALDSLPRSVAERLVTQYPALTPPFGSE
jgi:hypothetical protein